MGINGCNLDGVMDVTKFSKPMPWIGIYIASASLAGLLAMAADLIHGIRGRKLWFPCKYFCLNATSLTLTAVAVKLSVDLNTPMPHRRDQLAKLSSSALICTIMANSMPSLGITENKETMMNFVAMGILVITMIVNICIQFVTGVIYEFWEEHAVIMLLMLILLLIMFSSAVSLPKMKHQLELKYKVNEEALRSNLIEEEEVKVCQGQGVIKNLKDELMRVWMMAHTSSPQFVLGRSVTCTASGAFCLLSTVTLAVAMLRSYFMPWSVRFCSGDCDYKWSTALILIIQVAAVLIGTIAPAIRWFTAIKFRCPKLRHERNNRIFYVEGYWTDKLVLMKETPLGYRIHNRHYRKLAHDVKVLVFNFCIKLQVGIVLMSKATQVVSIVFMFFMISCCDYFKKLRSKFSASISSIWSGSGSESNSIPCPKHALRRFVLHLEGEEELVEVMIKDNHNAIHHWIQKGEKKEPKHLIELTEKSSIICGFKGVEAFDSNQVPPLHPVEAPYSWSLPLVTLASIAVALPKTNNCYSVKKLIAALNEGLPIVKFIDESHDKEGKIVKVRKAAEVVWLGVDLYHKWLDVDLWKLSCQDKKSSPKETLEKLAEAAKIRYDKGKAKHNNLCSKLSPSSWPIKLLASNSMYRISRTLLLTQDESIKDHTGKRLFEALTLMISDMLGACLTNLPHVISTKCLNSAIEEREDTVREAVCTLGKTKKIIEMLEKRAFPNLDFSRGTSIEDWRLMHKHNSFLPFVPCSLENDDTMICHAKCASDLCLNID